MVWDFERRGLGGEGQGLRGEFAEDIRGQVPEDTAEIREDSHRPPGHRAARQLPHRQNRDEESEIYPVQSCDRCRLPCFSLGGTKGPCTYYLWK